MKITFLDIKQLHDINRPLLPPPPSLLYVASHHVSITVKGAHWEQTKYPGERNDESLRYITSPTGPIPQSNFSNCFCIFWILPLVGFGSGPKTRFRSFLPPCLWPVKPNLSSNGDLNLNTGLDVDDDLLDDLGGGGQVDEALVDAHLEEIPGLGTLTARGLAGLLSGMIYQHVIQGTM